MATTELKQPSSYLEYVNDRLSLIQRILGSRPIYHIAFWILVFSFNAISLGYLHGNVYDYVICYLYRMPFVMITCYVNLYVILPRYYYKNAMFTYLASLTVLVMAVNCIDLLTLDYLLRIGYLADSMGVKQNFTFMNIGYATFYMISFIGFTLGIKLAKDHYLQRQKADMIEKERLSSELSLLKSQMQPHFFFNTLNNLYALTLKKSDLAPEVVLKLSELMSYLLYDTDQETTSLRQEINYINNYIDLESLRFEQPPQVRFEITGNCDHVYLPPILLLPFIENSFKHGVRSMARPIEISIQLIIEPEKLTLKVTNPYAEPVVNKKGGIGLRNVKRRLELLYEGNHHLSQNRNADLFETELQIPLS